MARQPRKSQATRLTADQMRQILDRFGPQMPPAMRQQMQRQIAYSQANPTRATGTPGRGDVPRVTGGGQQQRTAVEGKRNYQPPQQQLNQEADQIMSGTPNPQLRAGNAAAYRPEALPAGPRAGFARMAQANQMEAPPVSLEPAAAAGGGFFAVPGQPPQTAGSQPQSGDAGAGQMGPESPSYGLPGYQPSGQGPGRGYGLPAFDGLPGFTAATGDAYEGMAYSGPEIAYQPFGPQAGQAPAEGGQPSGTAQGQGGGGGQGTAEQASPGAAAPGNGSAGGPPGFVKPWNWGTPPGPEGEMLAAAPTEWNLGEQGDGFAVGPKSFGPATDVNDLPGGFWNTTDPGGGVDYYGGGPFMGGQQSTAPVGFGLSPSTNPYGGGPMMGGQGGGLPQAGGGGGSWPSLSGSPGDGGTRPGVPGAPAQTGLGQAVGGQQADTGDAGGADGGEAGSGDGFDAAAAYEAMQQAWNPAQSYARPTAGFVPGSPAPGLGQGTTTGLGPPMGMGGGAGMGGPVAPDQMMSPEQQQAAQQFLQGTFDQFQGAQDAANAANEARYQQGLDLLSGLNAQQNQMLGGLGGLYGQRTNQYAQGAEAAMNRYNDPFSFWASTSANVGRGYDALNQDVMNRTGLMGATEAENIRQRFGQQQAQAEQDLINRGLGNTTIRPAVQRGINYDQSRAQTGLAEDVANQMNQLDIGTRMPLLQFGAQSSQFGAGLLGNQAQAAERFIGNIANLQGEGLQFGERANQAQQGIGQTTLGWLGSRNDTGPDYNTMAGLASQIAAGGVGWGNIPSLPAPSTPSRPQAPNLPYMPPTQQQRPPSSLTPTTRPQARPAAPGRQQPWATIL